MKIDILCRNQYQNVREIESRALIHLLLIWKTH